RRHVVTLTAGADDQSVLFSKCRACVTVRVHELDGQTRATPGVYRGAWVVAIRRSVHRPGVHPLQDRSALPDLDRSGYRVSPSWSGLATPHLYLYPTTGEPDSGARLD